MIKYGRFVGTQTTELGGGFGEESNRQANGAMYMGNKFLVDLYPNPASFGFNLKSNCKENCEVKVEVLTITGQKLFEKNCDLLAGNCFINTHLTSGTYMVKITKIETMETITQKLIITNR